MVLRILRYVSPQPWGSIRAQAKRRAESIQRIVQRVWDPDPASKTRARLEAGANVIWTPFRICWDGRLKYERPRPGERFGWLASRAPPSRPCRPGLNRDISAQLVVLPERSRRAAASVLHDNRFLITFRLDALHPGDPVMTSLEEGYGRVMVVLRGRWLWPQVVWQREGKEDVIAKMSAPELDWYEPAPGLRRNYSTRLPQEEQLPWQDTVDFKFIRVLDEP
jgi:tRNA(Ile)-lysidine synthase